MSMPWRLRLSKRAGLTLRGGRSARLHLVLSAARVGRLRLGRRPAAPPHRLAVADVARRRLRRPRHPAGAGCVSWRPGSEVERGPVALARRSELRDCASDRSGSCARWSAAPDPIVRPSWASSAAPSRRSSRSVDETRRSLQAVRPAVRGLSLADVHAGRRERLRVARGLRLLDDRVRRRLQRRARPARDRAPVVRGARREQPVARPVGQRRARQLGDDVGRAVARGQRSAPTIPARRPQSTSASPSASSTASGSRALPARRLRADGAGAREPRRCRGRRLCDPVVRREERVPRRDAGRRPRRARRHLPGRGVEARRTRRAVLTHPRLRRPARARATRARG